MTFWRRSRIFRALTWIALAIVVVLVLPWGYLYWRTERDLQAELTRIREAGEPTSLSEVAPANVPDERNAAELYQRVFNINFAAPAPAPSSLFSSSSPEAEFIEDDYVDGSANHALARRALEDPTIAAALDILRQASERPYCRFPIDWSRDIVPIGHLISFRQACRWITARARLSGHDGDTREALQWCVVGLRVAGHCARDPQSLAAKLAASGQHRILSTAEEIMAEAILPREVAFDLLRELQERETVPDTRSLLLTARAESITDYTRMRQSGTRFPAIDLMKYWSPNDPGMLWLCRLYDTPLGRPVLSADGLACLEYYQEMLDRTSRGEPPKRFLQWALNYHGSGLYRYSVARTEIESMIMTVRMNAIASTEMELFETALALEMHRAVHGQFPERLEALDEPPGWEIPRDPCSGGALHYELNALGGYTLYSVGPDLEDDGGASVKRIGIEQFRGDVVWRGRR